MRPVALLPPAPFDTEGRIQWLLKRVEELCSASNIDNPTDFYASLEDLYQPLDADLTAIAALSTTSYGRAVLALASAAAARTYFGLVIGTDVQAYDELLAEIAALSTDPNADSGLFFDDSAGNIDYWTPTLGLEFNATNLRMTANQRTGSIPFIIDGGGVAITTGIKGDIEIPFACTLTANRLLADQSGSIVVDIWKDTYANFPPTGADSITASAKPTISTATKSQDTTLTGWTTSISAGDILRFNVDSISTITRVLLSLTFTKT